jgi:MFS family permease
MLGAAGQGEAVAANITWKIGANRPNALTQRDQQTGAKDMCFSESVSFGVGGGLIAAGVFASWRAMRINERYLPVAAMGFILFSWLIWPLWVPLAVYVLEPPNSSRKIPLSCFALGGVLFGLVLYVPHLVNPEWVHVHVNRNSIAYEDTMFLDYLIPRWLTYVIYLFLIIVPPLMSSYFHVRLFGLTLVLMIAVVWLFLFYAYISFFCLLAGIGSLHLLYIILGNKCCREQPQLFAQRMR